MHLHERGQIYFLSIFMPVARMLQHDVKIRVCLPRKYGRFMLFIDNNLLLPGARLHIFKK